MLQNKGETMHHEVHTTQTQLRESPAHPKKCVLSGNHLCPGPFLVAMGIFSDIGRRRKNTLVHLLKIEKKEKKKGQRPTRPWRPPGEKKKIAAIW